MKPKSSPQTAVTPQPLFCPIDGCPSRGERHLGNLRVHDGVRNRWKCTTCEGTFNGRKGTPFYRLKTDAQIVTWVVILVAFGCPLPAIVAAFDLDERTIADWVRKAGGHCQTLHEERVQVPQDLKYVQADEIYVKLQKRLVVWLAMALCVSTRLWLGAEIGQKRDTPFLMRLAERIKACAKHASLLIATDGWKAYQKAFAKVFATSERTGKAGRPRHLPWSGLVLVQTVKWVEKGRVIGIRVCRIFGAMQQVVCRVPASQQVNTAYIERLNATFRQRLAGLHRRTRCRLAQEATLLPAVFLVGTVYNFCCLHDSLTQNGCPRTPAMAAGLTSHCWSVAELLACPAVAPFSASAPAPKRTGARSKRQAEYLTV